MSTCRPHVSWRSLLLPLLIAVVFGAIPAPLAGADTSPDPGQEASEDFEYTGAEQLFSVPEGVRRISVLAVGGRGAGTNNGGTPIAGGRAAEVRGVVGVEPESALWILVGGNGGLGLQEEIGGFNGGGSGGSGFNTGGGGGGASDVRTISSALSGSLDSRLLVAAGGGGAGMTSNQSLKLGGAGGDAGVAGARAESAGAGNTVGSGGFGGTPGTSNSGGAGGGGGFPYGWSGTNGSEGSAGSQGQGGAAGAGPPNTPAGNGGGGGGGLYGGGGGGGGTMITGTPTAVATGGGGGGGGSSLVPPDGTFALAPSNSSPLVQVQYSTPGTTIFGPSGVVRQAQVTFELASEGEPEASFECRLDSEQADWEPCASPFETPVLAEGPHFFEARAEDAMTNFDPTPARVDFTVDLKPAPKPPLPPPPPIGSSLQVELGKPKLNRRTGTARLPVTANMPGRVSVAGGKVRKLSRDFAAGTLQVPIKARGKALRRLKESGKARVIPIVVFTAANDQVVEFRPRVTLRKSL